MHSDSPPEPISAPYDATPPGWRGAVVAIGNFDGVHSGHRAVLARARAEADALGSRLIMLTFDPHPRAFFAPGKPFFSLTPGPLKAAVAKACGVDGTIVVPFDRDLSLMSADDFVSHILVGHLDVRHAVAGHDFHFGHGRQGTPEFLQAAGARQGFGVTIVEEFGDETGPVSSTRIREKLSHGDIRGANELLGWRWSAAGTVIHGDKRGRVLGYPTANMALDPGCELQHGIYAVRFVTADGHVHGGAASFGRRPTFDNGRILLETFLFDFSGDLYDQRALVSLVDYVRPELRFERIEDLVTQMDADSLQCRATLQNDRPNAIDKGIYALWPRAAKAD
ncbi:riboflavin kinase / FMN adenylyltransferase [Faunimonas pinastri]|uniref:Riboflavin biosynthesis protein n=1 Tax=Faunimonas pinastri TaxID=1855383 RepID=A0A1H8ZKD3_9HYPH|nr:bifunctional riboflavin kinase/FAD synthetase [Faunimonas pinastri]SEP64815.1 riboflavin kinase / FMN adenylyltransferase [Faunimonas pinastri]